MIGIRSKRVLLAATGSNSGKTTITCALLHALKERGLAPVSFKCGPDYIDPLFHKKVLEIDKRFDPAILGIESAKAQMSMIEKVRDTMFFEE